MTQLTKQELINRGVQNLKAFGYSSVNEKSILSDSIFRRMFKKMLEANLEEGSEKDNLVISELIKELNT